MSICRGAPNSVRLCFSDPIFHMKMGILLRTILIVFAIQCNVVNSYKVLAVFMSHSPSHYFVGSSLMRGLVADGHHVTVMSPFKERKPIENFTEIHLDGLMDQLKNGKFHRGPELRSSSADAYLMLCIVTRHPSIRDEHNENEFLAESEPHVRYINGGHGEDYEPFTVSTIDPK